MSEVLVSTKYQVVIPKDIRREIGIKSGQRLVFIAKDGVIHLIPNKPISSLRGFLPKSSTENLRDKSDRL
jgi:AbrB family looped-hinge helix DNA binding protein